MPAAQPDLFGKPPDGNGEPPAPMPEQAPPDLVMRVRDELEGTLLTVRRAATLPWPDLTRATLAELRFNSIAAWLPVEEASVLRTAFEAEMVRLYAVEDGASAEGSRAGAA